MTYGNAPAAIAPAASRGERGTVGPTYAERGESARARREGRKPAETKHDAGPDLGLAHRTMAEAYPRPYPQIAKESA